MIPDFVSNYYVKINENCLLKEAAKIKVKEKAILQ